MPNDTVRASATALPKDINRRNLLGRGAIAVSGLAIGATIGVVTPLPSAAAGAAGDAQIIALSVEILRLNAIADEIQAQRIEPFEDRFHEHLREIFCEGQLSVEERTDKAVAFDQETGREAAIQAVEKVDDEADAVFKRMMAILATTQPGRAAKVRALLVHVGRSDWRGDAKQLNWPEEQARALLAEFAGMSAGEIANV